jgi:uncharacterized membrane protein
MTHAAQITAGKVLLALSFIAAFLMILNAQRPTPEDHYRATCRHLERKPFGDMTPQELDLLSICRKRGGY